MYQIWTLIVVWFYPILIWYRHTFKDFDMSKTMSGELKITKCWRAVNDDNGVVVKREPAGFVMPIQLSVELLMFFRYKFTTYHSNKPYHLFHQIKSSRAQLTGIELIYGTKLILKLSNWKFVLLDQKLMKWIILIKQINQIIEMMQCFF